MLMTKAVGRGAAARKYDILTALGAHALAGGRTEQVLALRLMTLITARYNWGRDELAVGQREIARLWSVDERTVKREMAKLRGRGWLELSRAGVRGRVAEYRLGIERLLADTRPEWDRVGPDFAHRLEGSEDDGKVVPLPIRGEVPPPDLSAGTEWALAQAVLHAEAPGPYASWLRALERAGRSGGRLTLVAPSRFHAAYVQTHLATRLLAACRSVDDDITEVAVIATP